MGCFDTCLISNDLWKTFKGQQFYIWVDLLKTLDFTEKFYFRCFLGGRGNMKGFVRGISTKILLKEIDLSQVLFFLSSGESSTTETRLSPSASPHQDRVLERIGCSCFEATANKNKMQNFDWIFFLVFEINWVDSHGLIMWPAGLRTWRENEWNDFNGACRAECEASGN